MFAAEKELSEFAGASPSRRAIERISRYQSDSHDEGCLSGRATDSGSAIEVLRARNATHQGFIDCMEAKQHSFVPSS